jgi:hypothetical protein
MCRTNKPSYPDILPLLLVLSSLLLRRRIEDFEWVRRLLFCDGCGMQQIMRVAPHRVLSLADHLHSPAALLR